MGQINTNNYPTVSSLADADLLIVENAIHGTGTTTPKQLRENAIGTDTLQTTAQTVTGAINELNGEIGTDPLQTVSQTLTGAVNELKNEIDTGANIYGINMGKVTGVSSQVASTNIDLKRMPKVGERILVNFEETTPNVTSLKTFIDGSGITIPISSGEPTNTYSGLYIFECASGVQPMSRLWNVVGKNYSGFTVDVDGNVKAAGDIIDGDGNSISGVAEGVSTPKTATGNPVIVDDALESNADGLIAQIVPIQSGSGDPSPTNIRPISGRTAVNLGRTGKNIVDPSNMGHSIRDNSTGEITSTSDSASSNTELIKVNAGETYAIAYDATATANRMFYYTDNKTFISTEVVNTTFTTPNNCGYIAFQSGGASGALDKWQIEQGTEISTYHAYTGRTLTIALGQTVYGGTLDVKTGVLTITYGYIADLGQMDFVKIADGRFYFNLTIPTTVSGVGTPNVGACSKYKMMPTRVNSTDLDDKSFSFSTVNSVSVPFKDTDYTDEADFKAAMSGVQFCYELATPIPIQLTGAELEMLKGYNYISTDADSLTVKAYTI